jgi:hypothetical protein
LSAPGLFFFVLTFSFAMVDWVMSIEPHWQSSLFGAMVLVGQVLGTIALLIVALNGVSEQGETAEKPVHDLGNLLMAFVLVWAYLSFSQYLIMWYANMPEEISWYLHRQTGGVDDLGVGPCRGGIFSAFLDSVGPHQQTPGSSLGEGRRVDSCSPSGRCGLADRAQFSSPRVSCSLVGRGGVCRCRRDLDRVLAGRGE